MSNKFQNGYTLAEVVVSCAILAIILSVSVFYFNGAFSHKKLSIEAGRIVVSLRTARNNAMTQEGGNQWGVHFDGDGLFYEMFPGATYTAGQGKSFLDKSVIYISPATGNSADIIFSKMTGSAQAAGSITIALKDDPSVQETISVSPGGEIEY